ncbi:hypothetical protein BIV57_10655 [Mangrovactinospora gilvigrisea]|uniref:HTH arsR-type domain-containing protein n=1 Tax=Mangrovactinospora gilvigrisea TaxID=1428644 RepID=A0A1J7BFT2_9ACTN|nr:hypothetical protein BIV57_10655 [Mangrovactinospora gilvigrisea]
MLRLHFRAADLGRVRVVGQPAPLVELKTALMLLRRPDRDLVLERWRRRVRRELPAAARPLLDVVASPVRGPAFVDPITADLGSGIEQVVRAPAELVRVGLALAYGDRPMPGWLHELPTSGAARRVLGAAVDSAHAAIVAPRWAALTAQHRAESARLTARIAADGLVAALAGLVPGARWAGGDGLVLVLPYPWPREVDLGGRGLDLLPVGHWTGPVLVGANPDAPTILAYPARVAAPALPAPGGDGDPLAAVLGRTRAAALRLLASEHGTGELARRLGVSAASASEQVAVLRAAGLAASRREGRGVLHGATVLGRWLMDANAADGVAPGQGR